MNCPDATPPLRKRDKLADSVVLTATRLRPLLELVERIRPHVGHDSVFSSRREKIREQLALVQEQLRAERPKHEALRDAFHALSEFVREEAGEVSKDEVKESGKRFVAATLKNVPQLISAANKAGLLS
ncbi:hypothetical protein [Hymenobacter rubripertinctus]|uniref:Uncharacterized protein n=1 Tax=Hymenobacter rubripertinctus TaxID=2029981 RepID=A0A418QP11_9BACT|nr:hypothetical protein [Hymenobacter rubripertinctus]RIY06955.1 hypothetical protein D0T11_17700 [Hymenobacter rubripertinctus]